MQEEDFDIVEQQRCHLCEEGPEGEWVGGAKVDH